MYINFIIALILFVYFTNHVYGDPGEVQIFQWFIVTNSGYPPYYKLTSSDIYANKTCFSMGGSDYAASVSCNGYDVNANVTIYNNPTCDVSDYTVFFTNAIADVKYKAPYTNELSFNCVVANDFVVIEGGAYEVSSTSVADLTTSYDLNPQNTDFKGIIHSKQTCTLSNYNGCLFSFFTTNLPELLISIHSGVEYFNGRNTLLQYGLKFFQTEGYPYTIYASGAASQSNYNNGNFQLLGQSLYSSRFSEKTAYSIKIEGPNVMYYVYNYLLYTIPYYGVANETFTFYVGFTKNATVSKINIKSTIYSPPTTDPPYLPDPTTNIPSHDPTTTQDFTTSAVNNSVSENNSNFAGNSLTFLPFQGNPTQSGNNVYDNTTSGYTASSGFGGVMYSSQTCTLSANTNCNVTVNVPTSANAIVSLNFGAAPAAGSTFWEYAFFFSPGFYLLIPSSGNDGSYANMPLTPTSLFTMVIQNALIYYYLDNTLLNSYLFDGPANAELTLYIGFSEGGSSVTNIQFGNTYSYVAPITAIPTTEFPTSEFPTTQLPTTEITTTVVPSTKFIMTAIATTVVPSTIISTTAIPTTVISTTYLPTSAILTTSTLTTAIPTTVIPTSSLITTSNPTTSTLTTISPSTAFKNTQLPTTIQPTSIILTTQIPTNNTSTMMPYTYLPSTNVTNLTAEVSQNNADSPESNLSLIVIGAALGGIMFLIIVAFLLFLLHKYVKKAKTGKHVELQSLLKSNERKPNLKEKAKIIFI